MVPFMGHHSDMRISRRFGTWNMQNLLYLQVELTQLEKELGELAQKDFDQGNSGDQIKSWYAKD